MDYFILGVMMTMGRKSKGYSQRQVADHLQVTPQNVSSWERGKSRMDLDRFVRLCRLYEMDPAETLQVCTGDNQLPEGGNQRKGTLVYVSQEEERGLNRFRNLSGENRAFILRAMDLASLGQQ